MIDKALSAIAKLAILAVCVLAIITWMRLP